MTNKYIDLTAIIQVIGTIFNNPNLLDNTDKYHITEDDFQSQFHKIVFGTIYNLHALGAKEININTILDYLKGRPNSEMVFTKDKGEEWLLKASDAATLASFDYYYGRLKKMTLLRMYDSYGVDVKDIYDPDNILDIKKHKSQEDWLDNATLQDIADTIDKKIDAIKYKYVNETDSDSFQAGDGVETLIDDLMRKPEVGLPLYGSLINTVTRGARMKKFYLVSAPTGMGKTRYLAAQASYTACNRMYDENVGWFKCGIQVPTLFIATEQDLSEIQTLILSFLSGVNEEHILNGKYEGDEEIRVREAAKILINSPLYIDCIPDFSLQDIENIIKRHIRDHQVQAVYFDYIHTSMKILEEITRRSGGIKLREDNVLFMLSTRLKDICNQYGIFIMSATQVNADWKDNMEPDQNVLRGAKAIADRIDFGELLLPVSQKDTEALQTILQKNTLETPNLKISVYKNRRGRYKSIYLWCKADLGICRINPLFATSWTYDLIQMNDLKINIEEGAF